MNLQKKSPRSSVDEEKAISNTSPGMNYAFPPQEPQVDFNSDNFSFLYFHSTNVRSNPSPVRSAIGAGIGVVSVALEDEIGNEILKMERQGVPPEKASLENVEEMLQVTQEPLTNVTKPVASSPFSRESSPARPPSSPRMNDRPSSPDSISALSEAMAGPSLELQEKLVSRTLNYCEANAEICPPRPRLYWSHFLFQGSQCQRCNAEWTMG